MPRTKKTHTKTGSGSNPIGSAAYSYVKYCTNTHGRDIPKKIGFVKRDLAKEGIDGVKFKQWIEAHAYEEFENETYPVPLWKVIKAYESYSFGEEYKPVETKADKMDMLELLMRS